MTGVQTCALPIYKAVDAEDEYFFHGFSWWQNSRPGRPWARGGPKARSLDYADGLAKLRRELPGCHGNAFHFQIDNLQHLAIATIGE